MADEKIIDNMIDKKDIYENINGYIKYCLSNLKTSNHGKEIDNTAEIESEEIKQDLDKKKNNYQKVITEMYDSIFKGGIESLQDYVQVLIDMYNKELNLKKEIKSVLVNTHSLQIFKKMRSNNIDIYPVLVDINKTFRIDDYNEISLNPRAALYGSEINKTKKGSTIRKPLENEDIETILELFIDKEDYKRFFVWVKAIFEYAPIKFVEGLAEDYHKKRKELKEWIYQKIYTNEKYKTLIIDALINEKILTQYIDSFSEKIMLYENQANLLKQIKNLEETIEKEKQDHEDRRNIQFSMIQEKEKNIDELREKLKGFDKCKSQLSDYIKRYSLQVSINESIKEENIKQISEINEKYSELLNKYEKIKLEFDEISEQHSALQSDYSLKSNELNRIKESALQREENAKIEVLKDLVSGISEQFFYLTMFYYELRDTGKLSEESIDLFNDTLNNIDVAFERIGISKIGVIDQKVLYDSSIYASTDSGISNGDNVVVSGYGWRIGEDVYIKAPVEKGDQL